jgi:hypothetical protein
MDSQKRTTHLFINLFQNQKEKSPACRMEKKEVANEPQSEIRSTAIEEYSFIVIKDERREVQPSMDY